MTEDNVQPQDTTVTISENEMEQINNKITQDEKQKVEQAKMEGKKEANMEQTVASLQQQLKQQAEMFQQMQSELKAKQEAEAKAKAEAEAKAKEEAEKKQQEQENRPQRKHLVQESSNPTNVSNQNEQVKQETYTPSPQEQWAAFEQAHRQGSFSAQSGKR